MQMKNKGIIKCPCVTYDGNTGTFCVMDKVFIYIFSEPKDW